MLNKIKQSLKQLFTFKGCSRKFARSFCVGVYIAFSPFVGFHTAMVFLFSWLFALNFAILLSVSFLINNPWTMVPVYGSGYVFGNWLLRITQFNFFQNPSWLESFNFYLKAYVGFSGVSLWAFLIGGNLLGLAIAGILYPIIRYVKACRSCVHC